MISFSNIEKSIVGLTTRVQQNEVKLIMAEITKQRGQVFEVYRSMASGNADQRMNVILKVCFKQEFEILGDFMTMVENSKKALLDATTFLMLHEYNTEQGLDWKLFYKDTTDIHKATHTQGIA